MSHAYGAVKFRDGLTLFCEYNGTVDVMITKLWSTKAEVDAHWRDPNAEFPGCDCGRSEMIEMATSYGFGAHWKGDAFRFCMAITKGWSRRDPEEDDVELEGFPQWAKAAYEKSA